MDDILNQGFKAALEHAPLVVLAAFVLWWIFPRMMRAAFNNGSGEIVRSIVAAENLKQVEHQTARTRELIQAHELVEKAQHEETWTKFDARITRLEEFASRRRFPW